MYGVAYEMHRVFIHTLLVWKQGYWISSIILKMNNIDLQNENADQCLMFCDIPKATSIEENGVIRVSCLWPWKGLHRAKL